MKIIKESADKPNEIVVYIECPPMTYGECYGRATAHNLNHIYHEGKDEYANSQNGLRMLTEKNLNRISKGHETDGYVILSASREGESEQSNNIRTKELRDKLRNTRYSYLPLYGGYKEAGQDKASLEKSFVVYPFVIVDVGTVKTTDFDKFKNDMINLAKSYDQDTILLCEPGGKPHYVALKPDIDVPVLTDKIIYNDTDKPFFTAIKKWADSSLRRKYKTFNNGKPQRYSILSQDDIDND